jgi:two-component system response regulator MprA
LNIVTANRCLADFWVIFLVNWCKINTSLSHRHITSGSIALFGFGCALTDVEMSAAVTRRTLLMATQQPRILIVEDEEPIVTFLRRGLTYEGYQVDVAYDGLSGLNLAKENHPDLAIIDWMLPNLDGLDVCRRLRQHSNLPIIILTARDTVSDKVQGLDAGADDYLVKPCNFDELLARIRAQFRRVQPHQPEVLRFGDLRLDTGTRQAYRGNRIIVLTAKEYELLELFLRNPRQVLTRELIFDRVWNYDFGGESNIIEVYVRYLRQKIEEQGETRLLHTVRGVGYVLRFDE